MIYPTTPYVLDFDIAQSDSFKFYLRDKTMDNSIIPPTPDYSYYDLTSYLLEFNVYSSIENSKLVLQYNNEAVNTHHALPFMQQIFFDVQIPDDLIIYDGNNVWKWHTKLNELQNIITLPLFNPPYGQIAEVPTYNANQPLLVPASNNSDTVKYTYGNNGWHYFAVLNPSPNPDNAYTIYQCNKLGQYVSSISVNGEIESNLWSVDSQGFIYYDFKIDSNNNLVYKTASPSAGNSSYIIPLKNITIPTGADLFVYSVSINSNDILNINISAIAEQFSVNMVIQYNQLINITSMPATTPARFVYSSTINKNSILLYTGNSTETNSDIPLKISSLVSNSEPIPIWNFNVSTPLLYNYDYEYLLNDDGTLYILFFGAKSSIYKVIVDNLNNLVNFELVLGVGIDIPADNNVISPETEFNLSPFYCNGTITKFSEVSPPPNPVTFWFVQINMSTTDRQILGIGKYPYTINIYKYDNNGNKNIQKVLNGDLLIGGNL